MKTLQQALDEDRAASHFRDTKRDNRKRRMKREVKLIMKFVDFGPGKRSIYQIIKALRDKHELKWLRILPIYSRHQNMAQSVKADLDRKVMKGFQDTETSKKGCNCPRHLRPEGKCAYGGDSVCNVTGCIYKITCLCCNSYYIGKTCGRCKLRAQCHIQDAGKIVMTRRRQVLANATIANSSDSSSSPSSQPPPQYSITTRSKSRSSDPDETSTHFYSTRSRSLGSSDTSTQQQPSTNSADNYIVLDHTPLSSTDTDLTSSSSEDSDDTAPVAQIVEEADGPPRLIRVGIRVHDDAGSESSSDDDTANLAFRQAHANDDTNATPNQPIFLNLRDDDSTNPHPDPNIANPNQPNGNNMRRNSFYPNSHSTLSRHLAGHCINMTSTAEVRTWCRSNIKVEILWKGSTTSLQKTAGTRHCRLCAMERVIINKASGARCRFPRQEGGHSHSRRGAQALNEQTHQK